MSFEDRVRRREIIEASAPDAHRNHPARESWPPTSTPGIGSPHFSPSKPPGSEVKRWIAVGGVLWSITVGAGTAAGWFFALGKRSADIPTKEYVDTLHAGQSAALRDIEKQNEARDIRDERIETMLKNQEKSIDEIKATVKDLAARGHR